jgi:predicted transposase/invertase (TIGR01784 family)
MQSEKPLLSVKSDYIFKLIFGDQRNTDILGKFLGSFLDIPEEEYEQLTIVDPHIKKDSQDDKYGILDVKIHTANGNIVHVEIQLQVTSDLKPRIIYSQSKLITEQMSSGEDWESIKRAITIVITDEVFIPDGEGYHHQFRYRTKDGMELTNLVEVVALDLSKLPADNDSTDLWYWMKFISSKDRGDMKMIAEKSPTMKKAVGILMELSEDEATRMLEEKRERARRDMVSLKKDGFRQGLQQGVAEGKAEGKAEERKIWESVVAVKDAEIKKLKSQIKH